MDLLASYGAGGLFVAEAVTDRSGVVGHQDAAATDNQILESNIDVAGGATITAHNLQASTTVGASVPTVEALEGGYGGNEQPDNILQDAQEIRNIVFDGNAILTAAPNPLLVVNEFGQIVDAVGLTASVGGGNITVKPIVDNSAGVATFSSDQGTEYTNTGSGQIGEQEGSTISGNQGSFTFDNTFQTVTLQNGSALNMVVNGIDPVIRTPGAAMNIQMDDTTQFSFTLLNVFNPTAITIGNIGPTSIGNLVLAGDIEDPIGAISLSTVGGNITAQGNGALVRGASVNLNAGGNIGTAAQRLAVQVVDSQQAAIGLNANAGGDLHLSVQARLRDPTAFVFTPTLGNLIAGGNIDLDLLPAVRDNTVLGPDYTVTIYDQSPTFGLLTTSNNENAWPNDFGGPQPLPPGIFAIGSTPYNATYTINLLEAGGNISVIDPGPSTIGLSANVALLTAASSISATVSGNIALTDVIGTMLVGKIDSTGGNVALTAAAGGIMGPPPGGPGHPASVIGDNIALTASLGNIGTLNNPLNIQLSGGKLDAFARDGINIYEVTGALRIDSVAAGGAVLLATGNGAIQVAPGASGEEVMGQTIGLTAAGGGIGTAATPLMVQASARDGVSATATGPIYLDEDGDGVFNEAGLPWFVGEGDTPDGQVDWGYPT